MQNPFARPLPTRIPLAKTRPAPAAGGIQSTSPIASRGMSGSLRAQAISEIAHDIHLRTARIQHLRAVGQKMQEDLKKTPQQGSSRIAWLSRQLDKDF